MNDRDLELQLRAAGRELEFPDHPDIAKAVVARIQRARPRPRWVRPAYVAALAMGLLIIAATGVLILSPDARKAVADLLGVPGIGIRLEEPDYSPIDNARRVEELGLGEAVSLEQAQERVEFEIGLPTSLGPPEKVFYRSQPAGGMATLVYPPGPELPGNVLFDAGMLLTQFMGDFETPVFEKSAGSGTTVQETSVNGRRAFWIGGDSHVLTLRDRNGTVLQEQSRPALSVLVWERDGVTYRLEGDLVMRLAVRIAESIE